MGQRRWSEEEQRQWKAYYPALFRSGRESATGFPGARRDASAVEVTDEERERFFENMWPRGGFQFLLSGFNDVLMNKESNKLVYDFWARKVRKRLTNPAKQKIMAPAELPYYFGTKRTPLEQDYYEILNQPNVHIHDLNAVPLKSFQERGLLMADDSSQEFDAVVLATGFDSFTGSLTQMGLKNKDGVELADLWKGGINTYLGLTISGFPNLFMAYSPQAPTPLSNGPTIIEAQVETIAEMIAKLEHEKAQVIEAQRSAEEEWKGVLDEMIKYTLIPLTDSWWNASNIPGKKAENMTYVGGVDNYEKQCRATMEGWKGFDVITAKA